MSVKAGKRLIDIGFYRGYQTCFLAKEYNLNIVAIDPGTTHAGRGFGIEYLMENAREFGIDDKIIGVKTGVPNTLLPSKCFDYANSTNCLEMIRGNEGEGYLAALKEIHRLLKKGGILGIGEPMSYDVPILEKAAPHFGKIGWHYVTVEETVKSVIEAGFTILEADYNEEAKRWWQEYATYCTGDADEQKFIKIDNGQWLSFGYVIAKKA